MGFIVLVVVLGIISGLFYYYRLFLIQNNVKNKALRCTFFLILSLPFIILCAALYNFDKSQDIIVVLFFINLPFMMWNLSILSRSSKKNKTSVDMNQIASSPSPKMGFKESWDKLKTDLKEAKKEFSKISVKVATPSKEKSSDVTFMYEDNNGDSNMESISPYEVTPDYISGFCNNKGKDRKFYHDRIDFYFDNGEEIIRNMMNEYYEEERRAKRSTIEDLSASSNDPNTINFIYQDSEGNTTKRSVIIKSVDYEYFTGICLDRHAERTFRKDRVVEYLGNAKQLLQNFVPTKKKKSAPKKTTKSPALTINFVGFSDDEQVLLEALAKPYNLKVLKTQTKTLFAIITNEELPEKQTERAIENGTLIMNKQEFLHFLETGEI